jgi:hypothetical protein
VKALNPVAS